MLGEFANLTELDLACTDVTDAWLALLRDRPLTVLNLSECFQLTHAVISAALEGMALRTLSLGGWDMPLDRPLAVLHGMPLAHLSLYAITGLEV